MDSYGAQPPSDALPRQPAESSPAVLSKEPLEKTILNDDTLPEWTLLSDAMAEYDEQMIQDWRDDLGNLLVFAGLFSGVVAGFALESYGWLEQDNSDIQVQLLTQISSQLASFSITSGFINSTITPTPLQSVGSPSPPSELVVRINTLWFLSLAVSLTASLLAIMVQQWLREYRLPKQVAVRQRVRLRQLRYDALRIWGVPQLVSLLPILLQVALILFLVGLCYLLANLDKTVAKAFIAFVGVSLSTYFAFTVLPVASRRCPYKNPFAHAVMLAIKVCGILAMLVAFIFAALVYLSLLGFMDLRKWLFDINSSHWMIEIYRKTFAITSYLPRFANAHSDLDGHDYWTARELDVAATSDRLDRDALMWAPIGLCRLDLLRLNGCLEELRQDERMACVCMWVAQALSVGRQSLDKGVDEVGSPFNNETLDRINHTFSNQFRHVILNVMPDVLGDQNKKGEFYDSSMLVILRHIARLRPADPDWISTYARRILAIRASQTAEGLGTANDSSWQKLPTACLYELASIVRYDFRDEEVSLLLDYAVQNYDVLIGEVDDPPYFVACLDMILGSAATALHAISCRPSVLDTPEIREKCRQLITRLDHTTATYWKEIGLHGTYQPNFFNDGSLLVTTPACNTICSSVASLARMGKLPLDDGLTLSTLVDHLARAFEGQPFQSGSQILLELMETEKRKGSTSPSESKQDSGPGNGADLDMITALEVGYRDTLPMSTSEASSGKSDPVL